jgi:hypothetical protein
MNEECDYANDEVQEELDALYTEIALAWQVLRAAGIRSYDDHGARALAEGIREALGMAQQVSEQDHARQLMLFEVSAWLPDVYHRLQVRYELLTTNICTTTDMLV